MCRALKSRDVRAFKDLKSALDAIKQELQTLQKIAAETDFNDPAQADQFSRNVLYLKSFYERCEVLIREQSNQ